MKNVAQFVPGTLFRHRRLRSFVKTAHLFRAGEINFRGRHVAVQMSRT